MTLKLTEKQRRALVYLKKHKEGLIQDMAKAIGDETRIARQVMVQLREKELVKTKKFKGMIQCEAKAPLWTVHGGVYLSYSLSEKGKKISLD